MRAKYLFAFACFAAVAAYVGQDIYAYRVFRQAEILERTYRWNDAFITYKKAVRFDPLNARYISNYGALCMKLALRDNNIYYFTESENAFRRASMLNPRYPDYWLAMAKARLGMCPDVWQNKKTGQALLSINEAFLYLARAIDCDPFGFNIMSGVCKTGLSVWDMLDSGQRVWITKLLRSCIRLHPWKADTVLSYVWQYRKDPSMVKKIISGGLVAWYHGKTPPETLDKLAGLLASAPPDLPETHVIPSGSWNGWDARYATERGKGIMYGEQTLYTYIRAGSPGDGVIKLNAAALHAYGMYPYIEVRLDCKLLGGIFVHDESLRTYTLKAGFNGKIQILSLTYLNDAGASMGRRSVGIGESSIEIFPELRL